jgi:hypothetical protein
MHLTLRYLVVKQKHLQAVTNFSKNEINANIIVAIHKSSE